MAATRIYIVEHGDKKRLVRASHPSPVVQHVSKDLIKVRIPTQDELFACAAAGIKVEDVNAAPDQLPLGD